MSDSGCEKLRRWTECSSKGNAMRVRLSGRNTSHVNSVWAIGYARHSPKRLDIDPLGECRFRAVVSWVQLQSTRLAFHVTCLRRLAKSVRP